MAQKSIQLSIVTPEGAVFDGEATFVAFPAYDGETGILPGHSPLLTQMGIGVLRAKLADGSATAVYVDGGFAQVTVDGKQLTILTEQSRPVEGFTFDEADALLASAKEHTGVSDLEVEARDAAAQRARVARQLAQKAYDAL
ncbi:MAG: ATP synthase F1 subunit epsilon [Acidobacteriota bacterium]